jgi:hypothetical protein
MHFVGKKITQTLDLSSDARTENYSFCVCEKNFTRSKNNIKFNQQDVGLACFVKTIFQEAVNKIFMLRFSNLPFGELNHSAFKHFRQKNSSSSYHLESFYG